MSSTIQQINTAIDEAEAAAMVMMGKAEAVITICRKARKQLAKKDVSTSLNRQPKVIQMVVADAVGKRAKKHI